MLRRWLDAVAGYKVLVVGDGIVDEYAYVKPQGKSPKENLITTRFLRLESFQGGVWAAAKHVEGFCAKVDVATGTMSTVKRRYVEAEYHAKLYEVHSDRYEESADEPQYADYDLVIVTDFGHGFVSKAMIEDMTAQAQYLAVNAQTNSANFGYNLITKYPRADYVVIDETEARLAARDREGPIESVIRRLGFENIVVTLGPHGSIGYDGTFHRAPAISKDVVDTMGAGDAFFTVTAPLARAGAPMPVLLEVGNAAGAVKVGVLGHRRAVTREALEAMLGQK